MNQAGATKWRDITIGRLPREGQRVLIHVLSLERAGGDDGVRAVTYSMRRFRAGQMYWAEREVTSWLPYPRPPLRQRHGIAPYLRDMTVPMIQALERLRGLKVADAEGWFTAKEVEFLATPRTLEALVRRGAIRKEQQRFRLH